MNAKREIEVYSDAEVFGSIGQQAPPLMGRLLAQRLRGKEVFSFEYDAAWLESGFSQLLDPDLQFYRGPQFLRDERVNFGMFLDSSPDRWGRLLMRRREKALAKQEGRPENAFLESDYLLGVYDGQRMGALRFKEAGGKEFMNADATFAAPPWATLRQLEQASKQLESDDAVDDPAYLGWLQMLIAPGGSLGGARPKAGVIDPARRLWIAKFPSRFDDKNIGAWEMVAHVLAKRAGINMSEATIQCFSGRHHTFLTQRFDREPGGKRIHFASAMTLLGYQDGNDHETGASYLHLAEFLMRSGSRTNQDLIELWRRIVFNIAISNTDDHLRNHGFILENQGWALSPAYDLNPVEYPTGGLKLNINEDDNAQDYELAMEVAPIFRLRTQQAKDILANVKEAVTNWRRLAASYGISRSETEDMENAFKV
jgi:serine/threonine-protein kinase HipA